MTETDTSADEQHEDDVTTERAPMTAGRAILTVLLALAFAALLCAPSAVRAAERLPYGNGRDLALAFARPVASMSHGLFLDRPREWLASLTGHDDPPTSDLLVAKVPPVQPVTTAPTTTTASTVPDTAVPAPVSTTTTVPPAHRVPTTEAPLKVWMGGDSLMGTVSEAFGRLVGGDRRVVISTDVQVGTGLARPDVLDWASELTAQLEATKPDIVFLSFGANDDQPMETPDGNLARLYTPEWHAEYARRAGLLMDIASGAGTRTVVWLGLPAERPDQLNNVQDEMNFLAKGQADLRPDVHFIDLHPIFDGPNRTYTDDVNRSDGTPVTARARDGVHLSEDGADILAPHLFDVIAIPWHLR